MSLPPLRLVFTDSDALTPAEQEQMYTLHVACFPPFREYYERNRYYSVVKPQEVMRAFDGERLAVTGKLLWRALVIDSVNTMKLFVVGMLIDADYRGRGLGKQMLGQMIDRARASGGDLLFGTTNHPAVTTKAAAYGFFEPTCAVTYTHGVAGAVVDVRTSGYAPYFYELRPGFKNKINMLKTLHLGTGPL